MNFNIYNFYINIAQPQPQLQPQLQPQPTISNSKPLCFGSRSGTTN